MNIDDVLNKINKHEKPLQASSRFKVKGGGVFSISVNDNVCKINIYSEAHPDWDNKQSSYEKTFETNEIAENAMKVITIPLDIDYLIADDWQSV